MATASLSPSAPLEQEAREILRCMHCDLMQFMTKTGKCRKCQKPFHPEEEELPAAEIAAPTVPDPQSHASPLSNRMMRRLRELRLMRGLTQSDLADRAKTPRTYISKIEIGKCVPNLNSLARLAAALDIPVAVLLMENEAVAMAAVLSGDEFLAQLMPLACKLSHIEKLSIIEFARTAARNKELAR